MTELNPQSDPNGTPEDVATLYSWANLHGAKYRDFSAARAQTREKARLRAEQALEEVQRHGQLEAEAAGAAEAERAAEQERAVEAAHQAELAAEEAAARQAEWVSHQAAEQARNEAHRFAQKQVARQQAAEEATQRAAQEAAQRAAQQLVELQQAAERAEKQAAKEAARIAAEQAEQAEQAARRAAQEAAEQAVERAAARVRQLAEKLVAERAAEQAALRAAELAAQQVSEQAAQQRAWQPPRMDRFPSSLFSTPAAPSSPPRPQGFDNAVYGRPEPYRTAPSQQQYPPTREGSSMPPRIPWVSPDSQEPVGRPAWLNSERQETTGQSVSHAAVPAAPEDTLQGSRDRLTSRWFALRGIFDGAPAPVEPIPVPVVSRAPAIAVFSLAGGVGKTSLVATLGRALSARGERVLLVDTAAFGLLPFFFGATDQRPGQLRTFSPPGASSDAPIQMVTIDPDSLGSETASPESLSGEIGKYSRGVSRIIVDLATASGATTRRIMRMSPMVLVPVFPDMNSVVSVGSIDAFFEHNGNAGGMPALPFYILNQFDASLPLHLDVREVLREQLGERLLPFALRRTPAMSEALAEGMTVMDYAPGSALADDFSTLAGWVKSLSAPATTSYRGVRWSER